LLEAEKLIKNDEYSEYIVVFDKDTDEKANDILRKKEGKISNS
jgi:hypothetical protein